MFKKFAAEALGLSDIGTIVQPKDYDKVDADDYLFHEDQEKIHFLIGDSGSPAMARQVASLMPADRGPMFMILDSDHSHDHVYRELQVLA